MRLAAFSATTLTLTCAVTSRCSLIGTVVLAERLDRLGKLNLALVDLEALGRERLGDVGRGHRPVERFVSRRRGARSTISVCASRAANASACALLLGSRASAFLRSRSICRLLPSVTAQRQLARQQEVARVAGGDLDHVAAACRGCRRVLCSMTSMTGPSYVRYQSRDVRNQRQLARALDRRPAACAGAARTCRKSAAAESCRAPAGTARAASRPCS